MTDADRARAGYAQRKLTDPLALAITRQREAEQRALTTMDMLTETRQAMQARIQVTSEPRTYSADSRHSWFVDLFRAERASDKEALERLQRHAREAAADEPHRAEVRKRTAENAYLAAFGSTTGERRQLAEWTGAGRTLFEMRAATRVDGSAGYEVPPAWLIDQAVPAPRADSALLNVVTQLPLPERCDTVNIPIRTTGTGTGDQTDAGPVASRDIADSFVNAAVRTIAGNQDVSQQWLENGSGGAGGALDQIIWDDLTADAQLRLDGVLILGSGSSGQGLGLLPPQTAVSTSLAVYAPNGNTSAGQQLYYNGGTGTALGTTIAQCVSGVTRARAKRPTHLLTHPWVWDMVSAQADQQSRPYVEPKGPHPVPPGADLPPGVVGHISGLPVLGDLNVPVTMGGAVAPYLSGVSGAQLAGQPGAGSGNSYTPVIPLVADDVYVFLGQPHIRLLREVVSGAGLWRFQLYRYYATLPNRYQAVVSGTLPNSGGWAVGACSSYGLVTQQGSNSLLSITGQGY